MWLARSAVLCVCFVGTKLPAGRNVDSLGKSESDTSSASRVGAASSDRTADEDDDSSGTLTGTSSSGNTPQSPTASDQSLPARGTAAEAPGSQTGDERVGPEVTLATAETHPETSATDSSAGRASASEAGVEAAARCKETGEDGAAREAEQRGSDCDTAEEDSRGRAPGKVDAPGTQKTFEETSAERSCLEGPPETPVAADATKLVTASSTAPVSTVTTAVPSAVSTAAVVSPQPGAASSQPSAASPQPSGPRRASCGTTSRCRPAPRHSIVTPGMLYRRACGQDGAAAAAATRCPCARTPDGTVVHYRCHVQQAYLRQRGESADDAPGEEGGGSGECMVETYWGCTRASAVNLVRKS